MADSAVVITSGTGTNIDTRTEATNGNHRQVVVLGDPATNAGVAPVDATAGLKVDLGADNDITGTVTANLSATDNAVLDAIVVDTGEIQTAVEAIQAGQLADGHNVTVDNASLTVDLGANNDVTTELTTDDLDTGAGTDTRAVVGLVGSASGGGELIPGSATNGLLVNLGSNNDVTVSGVSTAANQSTIIGHVDGIETLLGTIDTDTGNLPTIETNTDFGTVTGGGTETGALRVTIANNSTGVVSVDDGGGALTVDGTVAVTNAGLTELAAAINLDKVDVNIVSSDVATGGTSAIDDADFTAGTTSGTPAMGVYESTPTSVTDGDLGTVGITSDRRLKVLADLSATDNTVLDAIAAATAAIETAVEGTLTVTGGGGGTEYTEDVATANPIVGTATLIERDDVLSTVTPIEGDNIGLRGTAEGALWTQDFNSDAILSDTTAIKTALETAGGLVVNLGANNDVTVTGSVTADLGANNDVTVTSGTVTANLSATDNAVLDQIELNTDPLLVVGGGTEATAIRVTIANNSTGVLSVDDNGGAITVDGTVTADLSATDNAVLDAIAASTAAIETAVEGTLTVTGGGGGTEYTEDVATANPIVGTATMIERDDVLSTVTPIEGDNIGLRGTAEGALWTQDFNSDAILADTTAILADTAAIETATEATQAALETVGGLVVNLGANNDVTVTSGAITETNSTAILADTANIDTNITAILADTAAIQTAVEVIDDAVATEGSALGSGVLLQGDDGTDRKNVNVDATTGDVQVDVTNTVTVDLGANNDVTVTGTVDLGATDNAVLDDIAAKLATIDADTSTLAAGVSTEYQVDVVGALPAGTNAIGKLAANSGVDIGDVDVTSISAGTNAIGNVGLVPRTTGGMSIFRSLDLDETEEDVKTSAGQVFSISAFNHTAAPLYLKFYNATAANVTVGTTTPVLTFTVPGNADSDGAGFIWNNDIGFAFGTAICVAATTAIADADTGAPAANACSVNIGYA